MDAPCNHVFPRSLRDIHRMYFADQIYTQIQLLSLPPTLLARRTRDIFPRRKRTDGQLDGENYKRVEGSERDA